MFVVPEKIQMSCCIAALSCVLVWSSH